MLLRLAVVLTSVTLAVVTRAQVALELSSANGNSSLWIVQKGKSRELQVPNKTKADSWSMDGRWLLLAEQKANGYNKISLVDTHSAIAAATALNADCKDMSWSPNGRRFVMEVRGQGLRICDVSGSDPVMSPLLPTGHAPAWSPNGGRIAFCGTRTDPGIWLTSEDGKSVHKINSTLDSAAVSWSPDGRELAAVVREKDGTLSLVLLSTAGKTLQKIGRVESSVALWSPNGQEIAALHDKSWGYFDLKTFRFIPVSLSPVSKVQWEDSKTLIGTDGHRAVKKVQNNQSPYFSEPPIGLPSGDVLNVTPCKGLVLDGKLSNPFGQFSRLNTGEIRLIGTVEDIDVLENRLEIVVWTVVTPDGTELNLSRPLRQKVRIVPRSNRTTESKTVPLNVTNFLLEGEVALTVEGERAGVPDELPILSCVIPEMAVEPMTPLIRGAATTRFLESDGVCMDEVVVPLVFPVLGVVNWSDSFLASRGGGSRRHHGQDLMAPKMRPLVAAFDGIVRLNRSKAGHNTITLHGDCGWTVVYMHVNNDTPGTDDGKGGDRYAFAMGLKSGERVQSGQLLGFCGDSGNAEGTAPHCHFELHDDSSSGVFNACPTLENARKVSEPIVINPSPMLKVALGQTRWDIVVTSVDRERNVVSGDLITTFVTASGQTSVFPRRVYVKVPSTAQIFVRNQPAEMRPFSAIREGCYLSAIGQTPATDQAMDAQSVAISLSLRN